MNHSHITAVLWDLNGTLLDDEDIYEQCAKIAFRNVCGIDMSHADYLKYFYGKSANENETQEFLHSHHFFDDSVIAEVFDYENKLFLLALTSGRVPVRPGSIELMLELQLRGFSQALVTGAEKVHADYVTAHLLPDVFSTVITAQDVLRLKPDPHAYDLAVVQLGITAHECIALEDSPTGVMSARDAGVQAIGIVNSLSSHMVKPLIDAGAIGPHTISEVGRVLAQVQSIGTVARTPSPLR